MASQSTGTINVRSEHCLFRSCGNRFIGGPTADLGGITDNTAARAGRSTSAKDLGLRLSRALATRVEVVEAGPGRGHIAVHYHSLDQLDTLLERLLP